MLKPLSLPPEETPDEQAQNQSESRMLRALEALSSQPQQSQPTKNVFGGQQPSSPSFRPTKSVQRDGFRNDAAHQGAKPRHRFVRDGEVPVVHMPPVRAPGAGNRPDPEQARLHQIIEEQRHRADQAERARAESQAHCKAMQTKLAHAELALTDALNLAQTRLDEIAALEARLNVSPAPVAPAPPGAGQPEVRRGPGRPRRIVDPALVPPEHEPEPVQWWLAPTKGKRRI